MVVGRQLLPECFDSGWSRIEADVFFEGGKVDEISIQNERRHSILDYLLRVGRCCPNDVSYFSENALNILWKASDVVVDVLGYASRFHDEFPKDQE